jgi:diguanylate cyclase (GGDEF)-like protein
VAKQQGEYERALAYHEKFAAADKGYLNDISARTLAFQMVSQQVQDKKRQIDALNDKNQVLQLKQQVDAKSAETDRLYILLLIAVLGSIALWAWKTKRSQLRFMKLARRDGLTGIFNRQHFFDAALASLKYCGKSARDACVIVIDLDNFKAVNDSYGHAAGDLVLKRAVAICKSHLRSIDIFGRLGGEEFGIVLPDCTLETAMQRAEQLRAAIVGLSSGDDSIDFPISASFGVAGTKASGYNLRQLLIDADGALYQAKREGRDRVVVFHAVASGGGSAASTATGA